MIYGIGVAAFVIVWLSGFMLGRRAAYQGFWWPFNPDGSWPRG